MHLAVGLGLCYDAVARARDRARQYRGGGKIGAVRAAILASLVALAAILAACDREGPQVLLVRGTPAATPTTARVLLPTVVQLPAVTPPPAATPTAAAGTPVTPISPASPTPEPSPSATPTPTRAPSPTPTIAAASTPLPGATTSPQPTVTVTPTPRVHIVQLGETVAIIAQRYNTTIAGIVRLNSLLDVNRIYVGQRLLIP